MSKIPQIFSHSGAKFDRGIGYASSLLTYLMLTYMYDNNMYDTIIILGLDARNPVFNTGADQPTHSRSLISAFFIRVLESTISKFATSKISIY